VEEQQTPSWITQHFHTLNHWKGLVGLKSKENYFNLPAKKIKNIQKIINNSGKSKPHIKITTKDPSCKQIIILISKKNTDKFMISASNYVANINSALKSIKSDIMVDYIWKEPIDVTIVTNKVT